MPVKVLNYARRALLGPLCFVLIVICVCSDLAQAGVTKIVIQQKQSPAYNGKEFGTVGQYEILTGHAYGELSPQDKHNTIITDLALAPLNARGKVEYVATFTLIKPINAAKGNGVLFYAVPNRGNRISTGAYNVADESGEEFLLKRGYTILHSGWQGDLLPAPGKETITVPIARNHDGSSVTGPALARFSNMPAGTQTLSLSSGRHAANVDTTRVTLTRRAFEDGEVIPLARTDWAFADCTQVPFPGTPDPSKVSVKGGFDPAYLYELTYTAKDPFVLGIGFAATRDIVSFFRYASQDGSGTSNPMRGHIRKVIAQGTSQSGNFIKTFIHLGFNQDEANRQVWDGANDHIAGRLLALNIRFAAASGAANLYEAGSEGTLWWGKYKDVARGRGATSMLERCSASGTCPKIIETFGSAESWGLRMSPGLVGTGADRDIPLPASVRRYYFPGTTHGGGSGGFSTTVPASPNGYKLPANVNSQAETMRALLVALTNWVQHGVAPPPSQYPRLDAGQLVWPDHRAMGFPLIPGTPMPDNLFNKFYNYDFGAQFRYSDLSGVMTQLPPIIKGTFPILVPRTDSDGNEVGGVPSALHQAPLGTYLGWNVVSSGFNKNRSGGYTGGFIPFAKTKAERLATGDPRPSLEERYQNHAGYVAAVKSGVERLLSQRFLLPEDAERLVRQVKASDVLRPVSP